MYSLNESFKKYLQLHIYESNQLLAYLVISFEVELLLN